MNKVEVDPIMAALQEHCNVESEGWTVSHYIVVAGLERMTPDGVESTTEGHWPEDQPFYISQGLLSAGADLLVGEDPE